MTAEQTNVISLPTLNGHQSVRHESRAAMRAAVIQAIRHLFIARVPFEQRSPLFETATDLISQPGWSPPEMIEAAEPGPRQNAFLEELGLERGTDG